jgi:hypothetical protein
VEGTDYTVECTAVNIGVAYATVKSAEGSQYYFDDTRVKFNITAVALTAETLTLSGLDYVVGTEPSLSSVIATYGDTGSVLEGSFAALTADQISAIKALTAGQTTEITVSFTPANSALGTEAISKTLVVTAKAAGSEGEGGSGNEGGNDSTATVTGTNIAVKNSEVTVVLKSATIKGTGSKVVKPTVYVYTAEGKKLSSKLYHVDYDQTASLGKKTLTVTLDTTAYTFKDGANKASASYEVVDKSAGLTLTASAKAVTYGNLPEITGTVKQGSKTVSKTVNYSLKDLMDANGNIPAGIYSVAVSATVDGTTVSTQVLVTVKAQKATLKSVKLDSVAQADVKNLDKATLETEIENKIVANSKGTLSTGEVTVTINNWSDVSNATKTVKVKYTVKLNNSNKTFTSGKFVTSKDASVSLKVTK